MRQGQVHLQKSYPLPATRVAVLEHAEDIRRFVAASGAIVITGSKYCNIEPIPGCTVFSTSALDKFIDFDRENGILHCQAGLSLGEILEVVHPAGYTLPVVNDHADTTLGAAISTDICGSNHIWVGSFSNHVLAVELIDAEGNQWHCSREDHAEMFWNTMGGLGLTGIIVSAVIRLCSSTSAVFRTSSRLLPELNAVFSLLQEQPVESYTSGWHNTRTGRTHLVSGVYVAPPETDPAVQKALYKTKPDTSSVQSWLNRSVVSRLPKLWRYTLRKPLFVSRRNAYAHQWNFLFTANYFADSKPDKVGSLRYEAVVPALLAPLAFGQIEQLIKKAGLHPFQSLIRKLRNPEPEAILSFAMEGFCITLDFQYRQDLPLLLSKIDEIVLMHEGRLNPAMQGTSNQYMLGALAPRFRQLSEFGKFTSLHIRQWFSEVPQGLPLVYG
jgi:hypothetical protein